MAGIRQTRRSNRRWVVVGVACAWLALGAVMIDRDAGDDAAVAQNTLIHWRDVDRDWLVVLERERGEVAIYDAVDGRPLHRLDAAHGIGGVRQIVREGPWLVMRGGGDTRWINLTRLPNEALAAR